MKNLILKEQHSIGSYRKQPFFISIGNLSFVNKTIAISAKNTRCRRPITVFSGIFILLVISLVSSCATKGVSVVQEQPNATLKIAQLRTQTDDLPVLRTVDLMTGMVYRTYYDAAVEEVTHTFISDMAAMYRELAHLVAADPGLVEWAAVAFIKDSAYVPPRHGREVRWSILIDNSGQLGSAGITDFYQILPHEQVHAVQGTFKPGLPRWFSEGMAEWAGLQVTQRRQPDLAERRRADLRHAYESINGPLDLSAWGGVTVKREAFLRQVTSEQRARIEVDSTYSPPGPFNFSPDDFISDESNTLARYGGSLALFEMLEAAAGHEKMRSWFRAVWQADGRLNTEALISLANEHTGIDLHPWFNR